MRERETDLFGGVIYHADPPLVPTKRKRKPTKPNGYKGQPGYGPKGETCRSCRHYTLVQHANTYRKCGLMREHWTGGPGSDILARSPACKFWEKPTEQSNE